LFGLYSHTPGYPDASPLPGNPWSLSQHAADPLNDLAQALLAYCFPNPSLLSGQSSNEANAYQGLTQILTGDNVKDFLHGYRHYHQHWPLIHPASFNPLTADRGLVLAMCCVGAVYSDHIEDKEVRWMMELVRTCVLRSSRFYQLAQTPTPMTDLNQPLPATAEELQALALLHAQFLWHGSQKQRQQARDEFWALARLSRRTGLLQPLPSDSPNASALHQSGPFTGAELSAWNWTAWIENEKRARLMAYIFLIDASSTIFFNTQPQFDVNEVNVSLPADDAAWEAKTAAECASALGLRGEAAQAENECGTKRVKQLNMSEALQVLYAPGQGHFPARATNVFGKFVLIHAIHMQIYNTQRQILRRVSSSGTSTPPSQGASPSTTSSSISEQAQHLLRSTVSALEMWKSCWDADLAILFGQNQPRRGFCRDGIHFYFLAQIFLRKSRSEEWTAPPDLRCKQVFSILKQIRAHVASDSAQKGIEMGSVTTIADDYGIADITLNMRSLFKPLDEQ